MSLKEQLQDDMKAAMRAKEKDRLTTIRMAQAAIKQKEVDEQTTLDDTQVLAVLEKMVKQRRDAISQYENAGRNDLADKEKQEITFLEVYMPTKMDDAEIEALVDSAVNSTGAAGPQDMGKVMGIVKSQAQGRADMGKVSQIVKSKLNSL